MTKIVVVTSGGVVQSVYSGERHVDVEVIDLDDAAEEGLSDDEVLEDVSTNLNAVY